MYKILIKPTSKNKITLPEDILNYISKYKNPKRYNQSLNAWNLLLLGYKMLGINIDDLKFDFSNVKPICNHYYFSISHSFDLVAVMISDKECGIDIEKVRDDLDYLSLSKKVFKTKLSKYKFYKNWTIKEAKYKCSIESIVLFTKKITYNNNLYLISAVSK